MCGSSGLDGLYIYGNLAVAAYFPPIRRGTLQVPLFELQSKYTSRKLPYSPTSNPLKSSSSLYVFTSANLVPCPHQPLAAWAMIKEQFTAFCLSLLPWLGPLVYRDGVTPPLNPGRPPARAGESTRTPLISPEKLALPRPARGAPLASSLAGYFQETGGQWGPHPRTSPCAPVWPTASAHGFFFSSEKSKP